ncbi:MAG: hypothetical protein ACXVBK_15495, partial [Flavisolibacter sp.]
IRHRSPLDYSQGSSPSGPILSPGYPLDTPKMLSLKALVSACFLPANHGPEQRLSKGKDLDNLIQTNGCPIDLPYLPRRCPAPYKIRDMCGTSAGHVRDILIFTIAFCHPCYSLLVGQIKGTRW